MLQYNLVCILRKDRIDMNFKKITAAVLVLAAVVCLFTGCVSNTVTAEKDAGEVTIFVDSALEEAIEAAAAAYTKPVRELPEREKAIILIVPLEADALVEKVKAGEYADALFLTGEEALNALDAATEGEDHIVHSSRVTLNGEGGQAYGIAITNASDRQSVIQGFIDYLMSEEAESVLSEYGLSR